MNTLLIQRHGPRRPARSPALRQLAAACALALCTLPVTVGAAAAEAPARSFADMINSLPLIPAGQHDSEMLTRVTAAVGFIQRMELPQAQQAANEALQLDPRSSHLHFLNGFVYHLQARQGDTQKTELALEGYQQALRIDPGNWIAQEFRGLAHMDLKQFDDAKRAFSETLLLTPDSAVSVFGLMVAAYLTGDAPTACAMADQFRKQAAAPSVDFVRSSIAVYASCGSFAQAADMRATLAQRGGHELEVQRVDRRLAQWKAFYARQQPAQAIPTRFSPAPTVDGPVQIAQAFAVPTFPATPPRRASEPEPEPQPPPVSVAPTAATTPPEPTATGPVPAAAADTTAPSVPAPATDLADNGPRMLLVDVVLLSTQEMASTSKGVNLLNALTLQLGSVAGNLAAFSRVFTGSEQGSSTTITRAVTVPALSYSLNIANANSSVNEVLARPTLAAIEGLPSEFFSGTNLSAGVVSTSQQGGTTIVPLDKRFGIKLAVTPNFLPGGRVQLKVDAQRTSLNASAENPRAAYQIEIGETTANANVVMRLGDTLVLSGLSEKSSSSTRDGVPGLQDVPGLQYLFSNKKTNDIQRSVLILVTPRAPVQTHDAAAKEADPMAARMQALRQQFGFSGGSPGNVEAIMNQLGSNELFREFRQGDVAMERWDRAHTTGERLKEALGFLYY
jgi:pilus assembly protein CpaC